MLRPLDVAGIDDLARGDEPGLEAALGIGARYIAFIASERKAVKMRTFLKERGHDPQRVDAIVSPAGLDIGAVTPEEIALSVLAGVVQRVEQHRWIDVALMVGAVDGGAIEREWLRGDDPITDSGQRQAQPDTNVPEHVQVPLPPEQHGH